MSCKFCTDPDGEACYPMYGVAPHICFWKIKGGQIGDSKILPKSAWPANFIEDLECPGMGIYWCPECGDGKPSNVP